MPDSQGYEVRVVLVDELLERGELGRPRHVRVGEAATSLVRDGLDGLEDGVDEVGLLFTATGGQEGVARMGKAK